MTHTYPDRQTVIESESDSVGKLLAAHSVTPAVTESMARRMPPRPMEQIRVDVV
jgi:hypothetical protein